MVGIILGLIEVSCYIISKNAGFIPSGPLLQVMRAFYFNTRNIIQFDPACSRYDGRLAYTLRPGQCLFSSIEFSTTYIVNSLGLRDREESLVRPNVIVLGDSHAMGWGVEQGSTFSELIERELGIRVLNGAVSSYGTAREIINLSRLDRSSLQFLIIQYCPNDFIENSVYLKSGGNLRVMDREVYEKIKADLAKSQRYKPGMFVWKTIDMQVVRRLKRLLFPESTLPDYTGPSPRAPNPRIEAQYFLEVLMNEPNLLRGVPIIVFAVDSYGPHKQDFILSLRELNKDSAQNSLDLILLDLSSSLTEEHFFRLDDHLNPQGHIVVADQVIQAIKRRRPGIANQ